MQRFLLFFLAAIAGAGSPLNAASTLQFVRVNSPVGSGLLAAACDTNATFIAVGTNSAVLTGKFASSQLQWTAHSVPVSISLQSATFGNNTFLAGGTAGTVVSSSDGLNWGSPTAPFTNFTAYIMGLAFNPRAPSSPKFIAAPALFEVAYSPAALPLAWKGATMNQYSLGESWRAAAPFGQNSFVVCGFEGDIRYSSDGGVTWSLSRVPVSTQPDLLGIASDGNNRIVAVGVSGTLLFSGNGAASWSARTSPAGSTTLNAVAFDSADGLFIVVGNSGAVLTSPDGLTWTLRSAGTGQNFHGATFANYGKLAGVGLLVGDSGTAFLAGTPPSAPINPINQTNCAAPVQNKALQVTIVNDVAHPVGTVGVDWYNTGGTRVAVNTTTFTPTDNTAPPDAPATYTYFARTRDLRTGFTNSTPLAVTLTINPRPTATQPTFTTTNCNYGIVYILTNVLHGLGPWTVTWNDGLVQTQPTVGGGPVLLTRTIIPTNTVFNAPSNNTFFVSGISNADTCVGNLPGDIIGTASVWVNPRPTASMATFTVTNCNLGTVYTLTNTLTGLGPWTITWNDGLVQTEPEPVAGPVTLTRTIIPTNTDLNVISNNTFFVTVVSNADTCLGNELGDLTGVASVWINPRPTAVATVSGPSAICNGSSTILQTVFTGYAPWTFTWSSNGIPILTNTVATQTNTLTVSPVDASLNGSNIVVYTVSALQDANCIAGPGDLTNSGAVTVYPRPTASSTVSGPVAICNGDSTTVQATLTGVAPWTVTWSSNGVPVLTNSFGASPASINVTPADPFLNASNTVTYAVTALSDAHCSAGTIDLTNNAPVTIYPRPTASATVSGPAAICNGSATTLQAALTGVAPWTVTWSSNGVPVLTNTVGTSTDTIMVTPVDANLNASNIVVYSVTSLSDAHCTATGRDLTNSAAVTVYPRPTGAVTVTGASAICNGSSTLLQAALTGVAPWTITWASNGVPFFTNTVPTSPVPLVITPVDAALNGSNIVTYTLMALTDAHCTSGPQDLTNNASVTIYPRPTATASVSGPAAICNGSATTLQAALTGVAPWTVTWSSNGVPILTNTVATPTTTINVSPQDAFLNSSNTVAYSVSALSDAHCVAGAGDLTNNATVTVYPRATASSTVSGPAAICNGSSTTVHATLTGVAPWTVTWSSNGVPVLTNTVATASDTITVSPGDPSLNASNTVIYTVTALSDAHCTATGADLTNNASVTVYPRATARATVSGPPAICNGDSTTVQAALTGVAPWTITWASNGVPVLTNTVASTTTTLTVTPVDPSLNQSNTVVYTVTALSDAHCTAGAQDITNNASVVIYPRPTATASLAGPAVVCSGSSTLLQAALTGVAPWTVTWSSNGIPILTNSIATATDQETVTLVDPYPAASTGVVYTVSALSDAHCSTTSSNDLTGTVLVQVDPVPASAPASLGDQFTCYSIPATLAVSVPAGFTADWYSDSSGTNVLLLGSTTLTTNVFTGSLVATQTFWAATRFNDPALTNSCRSTALTPVSLITTNCPQNVTISGATNGVGTLQWYGNWVLQSTTNLVAPIWTDVLSNSSFGQNSFTWSNPPPVQFFRLYAPTN